MCIRKVLCDFINYNMEIFKRLTEYKLSIPNKVTCKCVIK